MRMWMKRVVSYGYLPPPRLRLVWPMTGKWEARIHKSLAGSQSRWTLLFGWEALTV